MEDLISVIIPVYNTEKYLERCLNSIINNTYHNLEIICINNGSTDNSSNILTSFENRDNRVINIYEKEKGVSHARNIGLDYAKGNSICFIDSDDFISRDYFDKLKTIMSKNDADLVICDVKKVYEDNKDIEMSVESSVEKIDMHSLYDHHLLRTRVWGRLYKKNIIGKVRFPEDIGHGEDSIFNLFVYSNNANMKSYYLNQKMYYYYQREESIVHSLRTKEKLAKCFWVIKHIDGIDNCFCKRLLVEESCKSLLNNRFMCRYGNDENERLTECRNIEKRLETILDRKDVGIPLRRRVIYTVFLKVPFLYKMFRLCSDPSMIKRI